MADFSPMMQQYFEIKEKHKNYIVFFRLGDFYEMFFDDAKVASKELELTLTGRDCGQEERAPMCGVPYHSSEAYIARLIEKGYKVAICEQTEDPATAKGIVKRDVVRIITPGTIVDGDMLDHSKNNFLACICVDGENGGIAFCDVATGEIKATQASGDIYNKIINELGAYKPSEVVLTSEILENKQIYTYIKEKLTAAVSLREASQFNYVTASRAVMKKFSDLKAEDISEKKAGVCAVGAMLSYLKETQKNELINITSLNFYENSEFLEIDNTSRRNLELTENMRTKKKTGSLMGVLDKTQTAMGSRLLRSMIEHPLINCTGITARQNAVGELASNLMRRQALTESLSGIWDIERVMAKIVYKTAGARDLRSLQASLNKLPQVKEALAGFSSLLLSGIYGDFDTLEDVSELIDSSIHQEPPFSVREGGLIRDGYNAEVDELRHILKDSKSFLVQMEAQEKEKSGIKYLKIGYNKVFGYYIEVTRQYLDLVPDRFIRKQTLTGGERFITGELKELESKILGANDRIVKLEYEIFSDITERVVASLERVQQASKTVALLDVICSFANVAVSNNYNCPTVDYSDVISIKQGRHPVVERVLKDAPFVPNDTYLDNGENTLAIITGPNMAGKSTYMRQVAIIVLMAQMGSFVPAAEAHIGVVDKIFTRVGASDDLATGQSTFMLEMNEVANIVKNATRKSLIIFDEIGRGTSTYDGMSIARAVLEYVADKKTLGAKSLFATHYHELTELEDIIQSVKNYNVAVKKRGDEITFLRRIVRGGADDSYGIEVAKLAGVNNVIIKRAKDILLELDNNVPQRIAGAKVSGSDPQISFQSEKEVTAIQRIRNTDMNVITPIEAFNLLYDIKKDLDE